jgi:hypothetical protein
MKEVKNKMPATKKQRKALSKGRKTKPAKQMKTRLKGKKKGKPVFPMPKGY